MKKHARHHRRPRPSILSILLLATLLLAPAHAQEPAGAGTGSPYFLMTPGEEGVEAFLLESTNVHAAIGGVIADVTVTQLYRNRGTVPIEATYVFPASTRA